MSIIDPTRKDLQNPKNVKRNSASMRLWHWANLIVIAGSLITVLINSTLTDQRSISNVVTDEFKKSGVEVSQDQARGVAHTISDNTWHVHVYFGYALAALFLFRLVLEFFQLADQKFIRKFKSAYVQYRAKTNFKTAKHELFVGITYIIFYLLLIILVITGLIMAFGESLPSLRPYIRPLKEVHGFCMYPVLAFILIHIIGVFLAERKDSKGIVSDMINGGKQTD